MIREIFSQNKELTMFNCLRSKCENDGYYVIFSRENHPPVLTLKDTVMNPDGWSDFSISMGCSHFEPDTKLQIFMGKPYCNGPSEDAKVVRTLMPQSICITTPQGTYTAPVDISRVEIASKNGNFTINGTEFPVNTNDLKGYFEMRCTKGVFHLCDFSLECGMPPFTPEESLAALLEWRKEVLNRNDKNIENLKKYIAENPDALTRKQGDLLVPKRLVDKGTKMTVKLISYAGNNAAFIVTKNCFSDTAVPEPYYIDLKDDGYAHTQEITLTFDTPGNTKLEFWVGGERIVRQIAVLDKGYLAVIPWVGSNYPSIDEEIHRFDIAGDYWFDNPQVESNPETTVEKSRFLSRNAHKYGDRAACFINGRTIMPDSETDSMFELDYESQRRGLHQIGKQMEILGFHKMELVASYTPDAVSIGILEDMGVKGLTSLCAWQNWQDGGWKINHCGVSNQPYYPADEDFRRAGKKRDIMCFTMGSASCNRNYSIMVLDGCPSNILPGERYFDNRAIHYNIQRFYNIFDGYIADAKNNDNLLTVTIALESFCGFMDWHAVNDMSVKYMVKKAATEKIVFTSAADVADYHKEKNMDLQEAYFWQPDYYYGYHNGEMPGRVADRIEAVTPEYLAVVRRGYSLPMYYYDYTTEWDPTEVDTATWNKFGHINPDHNLPSQCVPRQVYTEDMELKTEICGDTIKINIYSETPKKKMVAGVFDIPFEADFETSCSKTDLKTKKVSDLWTGNTHLFVDLGSLDTGETHIEIKICGTPRTPLSVESTKDLLGVMWFGERAYLRCLDGDSAIRITVDAPSSAYILLHNGKKVYPANGKLDCIINEEWFNEAPLLEGYPRADFEKALSRAVIEKIGDTKVSRYSGQ